jgi:zinc transport system substrate-binding protein
VEPNCRIQRFNAMALAQHFLSTANFSHPTTRRPLNDIEIRRLGKHLPAAVAHVLDVLDREMVDALAPAKGKPYVVFHDAYQYLEARYGLTPVGSITVNPEVQPSGRRLSALRTKIEKLSAVCILSEPQFEPKIVTAIARGTNARTGQLDPLGAAVEPGPELYFTMMRNLAKSLTACLVPAA